MAKTCDRVAVMYAGKIVELQSVTGEVASVLNPSRCLNGSFALALM